MDPDTIAKLAEDFADSYTETATSFERLEHELAESFRRMYNSGLEDAAEFMRYRQITASDFYSSELLKKRIE